MIATIALLAAGLQTPDLQTSVPAPREEAGRFYIGFGLGAAALVADETSGIPFAVMVGEDQNGLPITERRERWIDSDAGIGGAAQIFIGYRISPRWSVEVETAGWSGASDYWVSDPVGTNLISTNLVVWGDPDARVIPYAGIGIGVSRFFGENGTFDSFDERIAAKAKVGVVAPVARSHGLGVEGSFVSGPRFEDGFSGVEQEAAAFGLTATYR